MGSDYGRSRKLKICARNEETPNITEQSSDKRKTLFKTSNGKTEAWLAVRVIIYPPKYIKIKIY